LSVYSRLKLVRSLQERPQGQQQPPQSKLKFKLLLKPHNKIKTMRLKLLKSLKPLKLEHDLGLKQLNHELLRHAWPQIKLEVEFSVSQVYLNALLPADNTVRIHQISDIFAFRNVCTGKARLWILFVTYGPFYFFRTDMESKLFYLVFIIRHINKAIFFSGRIINAKGKMFSKTGKSRVDFDEVCSIGLRF
ncbi:hypothetical protein OESDEN_22446, partial [Oesophagostomum dentatum]